ncbi:subtilisin-like protease SBT4.15 [Vigna radiata var. radiata]|uniref:Subtilisin-like protease SBT4.15 n=1 Tax=Vigna radiata var. radiata TaxID=3916 RepID=A0A1S3TMM0_VIGRR|nr:subtilisin-like protease SBT4.15 [Vigna radiata var. radiata]
MNNAINMLQNLLLSLLLLLPFFCPLPVQGFNQHERKPYIVYMGNLPADTNYAVKAHHHSLLETAMGNEQLARTSKIHSYGKSFNGFVARLLPHEAERLQEEESVVSVFPNKIRHPHTTRSWDFLGMPLNVKRNSMIESHIIVGVLDTGISIDSPSFDDTGYGPPPRRWKGKCVTGANFTGCNNKVIGATYFNLAQSNSSYDSVSPADDQGHGTHTSSIVGGSVVKRASLFGVGTGTARGGVPSARLAMYKVCWTAGCSDMDMLAGFDQAIADGVNFISVSIGGPAHNFLRDPIAIGAFHAMSKGILTSCSAGNGGPRYMSVENVAPWILTVAASSTDRQFFTAAAFGDGKNVTGMSINTFSPKKKMYPLTSGLLASNGTEDGFGSPRGCDYGTMSKEKVKGRIVYCVGGTGTQDLTIKDLEGEGTIVVVDDVIDASFSTVIPATFVEASAVDETIDLYINSTKNPVAVIYKTTSKQVPAPMVVSFSSRGPQTVTPNIFKPDLTAPGVDILAAYSKLESITGYREDNRFAVFNILSGTSMSCPHVTATAAYVKSFHPDWSPAAIKSALMTTATPIEIGDNFTVLGSGSGQINPVRALHPGLVYDIGVHSYVSFLCKEGFNKTNIGILLGMKNFNCSSIKIEPGTDGINYPSIHIQLATPLDRISGVFYRTVTNVGYGNSTYKAKVTAPKGLSVKVIPDTLRFIQLHQKLSFKVVVKGPPMSLDTYLKSGSLEWNDSKHTVRSPIIVYKPMSFY